MTWSELYPFTDEKALQSARRLDLPGTPKGLAELVAKNDYAGLVSALVRVQLVGEHDAVRDAASER